MEFVSTEASQVGSGLSVTSQSNTSACDDKVDSEHLENGK